MDDELYAPLGFVQPQGLTTGHPLIPRQAALEREVEALIGALDEVLADRTLVETVTYAYCQKRLGGHSVRADLLLGGESLGV